MPWTPEQIIENAREKNKSLPSWQSLMPAKTTKPSTGLSSTSNPNEPPPIPEITIKNGRQYELVPPKDPFGNPDYKAPKSKWIQHDIGAAPKEPGSGQGRNDALTAATEALNGYLSASNIAESRRMDAFNQFQKIAEFALPKGATTAPGFEPGGPAQAWAAGIGLPTYKPPPIQTQEVNPSVLANEPALSPTVLAMLGNIRAAGGAG